MSITQFKQSLSDQTPPVGISPLLLALWYDGKEDWEEAHNIAQDVHTSDGSWVHAYLHRKEGDEWNARYWYNKAGRSFPKLSLKEEWEKMVEEILNDKLNFNI